MSETTPITIGLLIALLTVARQPAFILAIRIYYKVKSLCEREDNKWTVPQQRLWAERMRNRNPQLKVPEVDEVVSVLAERHGAKGGI